MEQQKIDAIFMEGTVSCFYFTGMRWGQSERTFGLVIPAKEALAYVCPKFEEDRARELIKPDFGMMSAAGKNMRVHVHLLQVL